MSYANSPFTTNLDKLLQVLQPQRILDLDREGREIAQHIKRTLPTAQISGLALSAESVSKLMHIYRKVFYYQPNAKAGLSSHDTFDLVVIHDFLEYVWKAEAFVLLNYLLSKSAYLMLVTPNAGWQARQDAERVSGMRSSWNNDDFAPHPQWIQAHTEEYSFFLLRGDLPSPVSIEEAGDYLNGTIKLKSLITPLPLTS